MPGPGRTSEEAKGFIPPLMPIQAILVAKLLNFFERQAERYCGAITLHSASDIWRATDYGAHKAESGH